MPETPCIDIVYLWVDGQDARWRAKRRQAMQSLGRGDGAAMAPYGNVEGRFRDNDELRYSLRALERFFPAHGHVYIVTDGQAPAWLQSSETLTLVDHRELIPAYALPTFDSGNIESYIHRIPGLSERYFYCNDDVFFGAPVQAEDWFWPGGFYVAWSDEPEVRGEAMQHDANSLENACRLSHQWLAHKAAQIETAAVEPGRIGKAAQAGRPMAPRYERTNRTFAHSPRPLLKSVLFELEREAPELFDGVRSTVFRRWDRPTIVSDFVLRWALAHGLARVKDYRHSYVCTGGSGQGAELQRLAAAFGELDFFCLNDTTDDAHANDPRLKNVQVSLQQMLPWPSRFEKAARLGEARPIPLPDDGARDGTQRAAQFA